MRNFYDPWANILDEKGKLLVGRITFYEANTTDKKNIYGTDGVTVLPNPIYTDGFGKTMNQVLLEDSDYTIRFERYIGNGNMETDPSESAWMNYKTVLSKNGDFTNIISGSNIVSVKSVDELKAISNMQDGDVVQLIGYFNAGDSGEPRLYIWHSTGSVVDDGGVTIKSSTTNTGYWRMVIPGTYIDVRWYGDLPDTAANPENPKSNLGQRAKAAQAANIYRKDLYFPCSTSNTNGFYIFDGSNTVSVNKDIICDNGVRFVVRTGTSGTAIQCHELHKCERYLFIPPVNGTQIGQYTLTADWIKASWLRGWVEARGAREGYILDEMSLPLQFENAKIKIENSPMSGTVMNNCQILEGHKVITNSITMQNMTVKTEWFADDYNYSLLTLSGCHIILENCKDANTYILLKNKQLESDYGDLGEQQINAQVRAGGTIENCYGTVTFISHGNTEFHNASLTVNGLSSTDSVNAVDSWLTIPSDIVLNGLQLRRGSLAGAGGITLIADSLIENANVSVPVNTTGTLLTIRNSEIFGYITTRNIKLINNQIYNVIDQSDLSGVINVYVSGNMFHDNGIHYLHADTANSVVNGIWANNGSTYTDKHWIRLDRTNLKVQDIDHHYTYAGNSEPYLDQWSGRNRPMAFKMYSGHWTRSASGTGIFSTYTIPFMFVNDRDLTIYCVPRQNYWKMFSVGRGFLCRSGCIKASCNAGEVGIMEGDYNDHTNGNVAPVFNWGCGTYNIQRVQIGTEVDPETGVETPIYTSFEDYPDRTKVGCAQCVSRDGNGIAEYNCSFEAELTPHGEYNYGMQVGFFPSHQWNGAQNGTGGSYGGSLNDKWVKYPANSYQIVIYVFIDKDFSTGSNPQNVFE